jgi:dienelactone hydrolase
MLSVDQAGPVISTDRMRRIAWLICGVLCGGVWAQESAAPAEAKNIHYVQREFRMPYMPAGVNGLDVLEVRVESATPRPLAILTHGTAYEPEKRAQVTPWAQLEQAVWFARRGFVAVVVVRQGYGRSGGKQDGTEGGCGNRGSFVDAGEASANDLRGVAKYMSTQPEVDASEIVSVGVSTGGFAQVALAANPPPGLKAAISFAGGRGGDGKGDNCNLGGLISAFHDFGKHDKVPMLWLYAENDKWFPPKMSVEFDKAYHGAGGQDEFVLVGPDGEDGHGYYRHISAWSDRVEAFLKAHDALPLSQPLPLPPVPDVPLPPGMSERSREAFDRFLMSGPYRALATSGTGHYGYSTGQFTQEIADKASVENCEKVAKGSGKCVVVSRGVQPVAGK